MSPRDTSLSPALCSGVLLTPSCRPLLLRLRVPQGSRESWGHPVHPPWSHTAPEAALPEPPSVPAREKRPSGASPGLATGTVHVPGAARQPWPRCRHRERRMVPRAAEGRHNLFPTSPPRGFREGQHREGGGWGNAGSGQKPEPRDRPGAGQRLELDPTPVLTWRLVVALLILLCREKELSAPTALCHQARGFPRALRLVPAGPPSPRGPAFLPHPLPHRPRCCT